MCCALIHSELEHAQQIPSGQS